MQTAHLFFPPAPAPWSVPPPSSVTSCHYVGGACQRGAADTAILIQLYDVVCSAVGGLITIPDGTHLQSWAGAGVRGDWSEARSSPHPSALSRPCLRPSKRVPARSVPSKPPPAAPALGRSQTGPKQNSADGCGKDRASGCRRPTSALTNDA